MEFTGKFGELKHMGFDFTRRRGGTYSKDGIRIFRAGCEIEPKDFYDMEIVNYVLDGGEHTIIESPKVDYVAVVLSSSSYDNMYEDVEILPSTDENKKKCRDFTKVLMERDVTESLDDVVYYRNQLLPMKRFNTLKLLHDKGWIELID